VSATRLCTAALALLLSIHLGMGISPAQTVKSSAAQSALRVVVLDPNHAAIAAAEVTVQSAQSALKTLTTDHRGEAAFAALVAGRVKIRVQAKGFEPREVDDYALEPGSNLLEIVMQIANLKDEVHVSEDKRERQVDPRGTAFTTILTEEQIAELPDDPEEFAATLREMAGPGAVFRVNGFTGGRFPPKSQIREIRFKLNPYAAENHDAGFVSVDIYTKPGMDAWHGSVNFGYRSDALNARNFFAPVRGPESYRRAGFTLDGPLWRDHTSLFLYGEGSLAYDSKTIVAALPGGPFNQLITHPTHKLDLSARLEQTLSRSHTLRLEYQRNAYRQDNLGVGNFDLPDRAYRLDGGEHLFRVSDTGLLTHRFVNEFRLQARWQELMSQPVSEAPALIVLNAFNSGGAQVQSTSRTREIEIADNLDYAIEAHSLRAGIDLQRGSYSSEDLKNATGTFIFSSLAAFESGRPTTYNQRLGDPHVEFDQYQFGWYVQDDIRAAKGLTLSLGLRHEFQSHLADQNNFAPRLGVAWSPFRDGKTTIRAGAGIFYDWFTSDTFEQTLRVDGRQQRDLVVRAPGFPDPFSSGSATTLPPGIIQSDPALRMPYIEGASIGLEREISLRFHVRAAYFYQRGVHLLRGRNINAPLPGLGRPDPAAGNIDQIESSANSTLRLFNFNVSNFTKRFMWLVNYTLSRSLNESDGPLSLPANNFDLHPERGPSPGDARHRLYVMTNTTLVKGVKLGVICHYNTATPYNITTGLDDNLDTVSNDRPPGVTRNSARGSGLFDLNTRLSWGFGFGQQKKGSTQISKRVTRIGDSDSFAGPSAEAMDRRWRVQLYLQVYNLLNHANLTNYTGVQTSPFFGQPTAALPGRRMETGMRFSF
jgi:TonB dependent receptor/Carboxypeptidase regulatory-like domain